MDHQLNTRATALRVVLGLTATLAGLDKFFNILADWGAYVSPLAMQVLPIPPETFMYIVGAIEVAVGIAILGAAPVLGAYVASIWLLLVAGNLLLAGFIDVAVRDVVMSVSAFTLARLLELGREATAVPAITDGRRHVIA